MPCSSAWRASSSARSWAWRPRGAAAGGVYGALRDKGVSDKVMKLAGKQLEAGQAAVFVLADDEVAAAITDQLASLGGEIEVGEFPVEAQKLVREELKLQA